MTLRLGDTAPDFEQDSTIGRIRFHDWAGDSWVVLFSHPADFHSGLHDRTGPDCQAQA
jgi:alkyl hydroperoxide reductase subunit AhpC